MRPSANHPQRRAVAALARLAGVAGLAGLALVAVGCSSGGSSPGSAGEPTAPTADLATGRTAFAANCATCHGTDLTGTDSGPSFLSEVYVPDHHPDDAFRSAVANGSSQHHWEFGDMPPVEGLTAAEVEAIIAFIRSEQTARGFDPYPPAD